MDAQQAAAMRRMEMRRPDESVMANEGQPNAGGAMRRYDNGQPYFDPEPMSEYPRMLYRKTDKEQTQEWADSLYEKSTEKFVTNRVDGLLCDTIIAKDADEAERLASDGWEISPKAAYGQSEGIGKQVSAKDARIAELEAQLKASQTSHDVQDGSAVAQGEVKRGPGRPPKVEDI